jgi:hypothetical protein
MAGCAHKGGGRCSCKAPASVAVGGHWRQLTGRRKKRAPAKPKAGTTYYVAEDSTGRTCDHHHRTRSGARTCATKHQRAEVVYRARYLSRKQAAKTRVRRWDVTTRNG